MPPKLEKMLINKGRNAVSKTACRGFKSFCPCQSKKTPSGVFFILFGLNCMKPRRAERAGANHCAAACGGGRRGGEVKKQGAVRSAPSEQCDYVSEGQLQVLLPLPKQKDTFGCLFYFIRIELYETEARGACRGEPLRRRLRRRKARR